nr:terpene synthase 28 [Aquilaria agallochum]
MALTSMSSDFLCLSNSNFSGPKLCLGKSKCPSQKQGQARTSGSGYLNIKVCYSTSRRSANYQPNSWDYDMLQSLADGPRLDDKIYNDRAKLLKEEVRCLIWDKEAKSSDILLLIDDIQRLGLRYHFKDDIILALHRILQYEDFSDENCSISSLCYVALKFRLLRQHGFEVSQEVFKKFKGEDGKFKAKLSKDVEGVLSLYEASHFGFEGEDVLDEAKAFTRSHLTHTLKHLETTKALFKRINHALELPFPRQMRRLEAQWTIETYASQSNANHALLQFAMFDFNFVQSAHQVELRELTRWWRALGLSDKLSFARDRLMECFFWSVGITPEPQYGKCRKALAKVACFVTVIDDVYDVYGTLDELELFTRAVERWDVNMVDDLPDYMKLCFLALYNTINEIAFEILQERGISVISYLAKAWADLFNTFLQEAKWSSSNIKTKELESLQNYHALLRLPSLIFRLCNDYATYKAELEKGDATKGVLCYMKETGKIEEEAQEHIAYLIEEAWKKLNKEATGGSPFSKAFEETALDVARVAQCHYQYGDGHGAPDSRSKNRVSSLFIEPIPLNWLETKVNNKS